MKNGEKNVIIIIGAGVAGLTAGVYARKLGYHVSLYEKNAVPGGECTGWDRHGYHIDNCIHWLIGSVPGSDLYKIYQETDAITPETKVYTSDIMYTSYLKGEHIALHNDLEKMRQEWTALSPEDKESIDKLCDLIKIGEGTSIPAGKPSELTGAIGGCKLLWQCRKMFKLFSLCQNMTTEDLLNTFKHPLIRACITDFCTKESDGYSFPSCYGNFISGDGGVPIGGSKAMAERMQKKFVTLGGQYFGSSPVKNIVVENGHAKGITLDDGTFAAGDYIIPACDADFTFNHLLDPSYMDPVMKAYFDKPEVYPIYEMFQAAWAVDSPDDLLKGDINLEAPTTDIAPFLNNRISLKSFGYQKEFAPEGKQVIQVLWGIDQRSWPFWQELYQDKEKYQQVKKELASLVQEKIEAMWPAYRGKLTLLDTWTPCTYKRYCNAHNGYNQACSISRKTSEFKIPYPSAYVKGLDNVVLAGQWVTPPGGVSGSCITGKFAAYRIDHLVHKKWHVAKKIIMQYLLPSAVVIALIAIF